MANKNPENMKQKRPRSKSANSLVWTLVFVGGLMAISLPTVILVFFGMMPTLVAAIVDRSKGKSATFCVGGMNFCGVFPWLVEVWFGHHSISNALSYLTDPFILVIMLGSSAFGWMMFVSVPPAIISVLTVTSQHKVASLREDQKEMITAWGNEVANLAKERASARKPQNGAGGKTAKAAPVKEKAADAPPPPMPQSATG